MADQPQVPIGSVKPNTGITVPFQQLYDQTSESADKNGIYASISYLVRWTDRWTFYEQMLGKTTIFGTSRANFVRYVPAQYPDNPRMYATAMRMTPAGKATLRAGVVGVYDYAMITVDFASPPWQFDGDSPYRTEKMSFSAEQVELPEASYIFPDGTPVNNRIGYVLPTIELSVTTHSLPFFPFEYVFGSVGTVNADVWYGADPGTMLFLGCETSRKSTPMAVPQWDAEWKFVYKSVGWNKLKHPVLPTYEFVFQRPSPSNPNPEPIYRYTPFSSLPV